MKHGFTTNHQFENFRDLVSDRGACSTCDICDRFPVPTTLLDDIRQCQDCAPDDKNLKFDKFDGKFKCPAVLSNLKSCGADKLSPRDFWIGSCCDAASLWVETRNYPSHNHGTKTFFNNSTL